MSKYYYKQVLFRLKPRNIDKTLYKTKIRLKVSCYAYF